MARPIALRNLTPLTLPTSKIQGDEPQLEVQPKTLWSPPQGLDYLNRKNRVDVAHAPEMLNLLLDIGVKRSRKGTSLLGAAAADPVMAVVNFVTGSGVGFILRFTTTKLQRWNGAAWVDLQAGFTGSANDFWTYTAFANALLFSNGVNGLWEYAPLTGLVQLLPQGPSCKHLTVVGGRVVAGSCNGQEYTTMWSVKNNSHDWTGIGSGTEDLLSTPGGQVDSVLGTFPITDDTSLMVRTNSVWLVSQTGDEEAPFGFRRLHHKLGSRSRHSIDVIPGGIVMVGNDDIYLVGVDQPVPIGTLIKSKLTAAGVDLTKAQGRYRSRLKQYWFTLGGDEVFAYSFLDKGWSRLKYPFDVRWMEESIFHYGGSTWDEQVVTWDAAVGTWEGSTGNPQAAGFFMATTEAAGNTIQELTTSNDAYIQAGKVAVGIEVQTPEFNPITPLDTVQVNETQMEYEAAELQDVQLWWSQNGGVTWNLYSEKQLSITQTVEILRATKQIERPKLMLRMTSGTLGQLTLVSLSPFLVVGAKREP